MFGIGFTEILLISIIAILFLGPDKLPGALVEMGKFIKSVKKTVNDAKSSLEEEMKISDLKEEALNYKKQLSDATEELKGFKNLSFDDEDDITYDDEISEESPMAHVVSSDKKLESKTKMKETKIEEKNDMVTFKKERKTKVTQKPKANKSVAKKNDKNDDKGKA